MTLGVTGLDLSNELGTPRGVFWEAGITLSVGVMGALGLGSWKSRGLGVGVEISSAEVTSSIRLSCLVGVRGAGLESRARF